MGDHKGDLPLHVFGLYTACHRYVLAGFLSVPAKITHGTVENHEGVAGIGSVMPSLVYLRSRGSDALRLDYEN